MKWILRLEAAGLFILGWWLSTQLPYSGWLFFAWLLAPDLSMIGYAFNTRAGALLYNIAHHQGIAILVGFSGHLTGHPALAFAGCILLAHSAMDRLFGYGLKYADDFRHTHLGWLNKNREQQ